MERDQQVDLIHRLRTAKCHLDLVIEMVEADQSCIEVLRQIFTVKRALRAARALSITCQARQSETIIRVDPDPQKRVDELARLEALFVESSHHSNHQREVSP